jgi:hypothetical protein
MGWKTCGNYKCFHWKYQRMWSQSPFKAIANFRKCTHHAQLEAYLGGAAALFDDNCKRTTLPTIS